VLVRFQTGDFADIGAATATEVAAVLIRRLTEITAKESGGRLVLAVNTVGTRSTLNINRLAASLDHLESAPRAADSSHGVDRSASAARMRLVYAMSDRRSS